MFYLRFQVAIIFRKKMKGMTKIQYFFWATTDQFIILMETD